MNILFSVILLVGALYFVWWGYKNLVRREQDTADGAVEGVACHLCGQGFPQDQVVTVEKKAGFENYFCGNCIARLGAEYNRLVRAQIADPIFGEHALDGRDDRVAGGWN